MNTDVENCWLFIRGLDALGKKAKAPAADLPIESVSLSLRDLTGYLHPPDEQLEHEDRQNRLRALKNRQNLFQEEVRGSCASVCAVAPRSQGGVRRGAWGVERGARGARQGLRRSRRVWSGDVVSLSARPSLPSFAALWSASSHLSKNRLERLRGTGLEAPGCPAARRGSPELPRGRGEPRRARAPGACLGAEAASPFRVRYIPTCRFIYPKS